MRPTGVIHSKTVMRGHYHRATSVHVLHKRQAVFLVRQGAICCLTLLSVRIIFVCSSPSWAATLESWERALRSHPNEVRAAGSIPQVVRKADQMYYGARTAEGSERVDGRKNKRSGLDLSPLYVIYDAGIVYQFDARLRATHGLE